MSYGSIVPPAGTWMRSAPEPSVWSRVPTTSCPSPSRADEHGRRAVAKARARREIARIEVASRVELAGDHEHARSRTRTDQRIRDVQRKHRTRADRAHVEGVRPARADQLLHARGRCRLDPIGRRGREHDGVELVGRHRRALQAEACGLRAEIGRVLVVCGIAPGRDAGLLRDEGQRRGRKLRQRFVRNNALGQVRCGSEDLSPRTTFPL